MSEDTVIAGLLLAYLVVSSAGATAVHMWLRRYERHRAMYYADQQRLAQLRWERDATFRD